MNLWRYVFVCVLDIAILVFLFLNSDVMFVLKVDEVADDQEEAGRRTDLRRSFERVWVTLVATSSSILLRRGGAKCSEDALTLVFCAACMLGMTGFAMNEYVSTDDS